MDRGKAGLTVFFEGPFWVGVFERIEDWKLSVCREADHAGGDRHKVPAGAADAEGRKKGGAQAGRQGTEGGQKRAAV